MTFNGWIQIAIYFALIMVCVKPLGLFMARVFEGERTFLSPIVGPIEHGIYRICGVNKSEEQHWTTYTIAMLLFSVAGFVLLYALQRFQAGLPLNPAGHVARSRRTPRSTPPSASPPIPTGRATAAKPP